VPEPSSAAPKQESGLIIGVVKETETSDSKRCTVVNIEIGKEQNLLILIKNNASFLIGRPVVYDEKRQIVLWLENDSYVFRIVGPVKATDEVPDEPQTICPECHSLVGVSELTEHLKVTHRLPRKPFGLR
jgi:hypothetical protein